MTAPLLARNIRGGPPAPQLLTAAGLVQLGDSAFGARQGKVSLAASRPGGTWDSYTARGLSR